MKFINVFMCTYLPSNLAIAAALGSGLQTIFVGLDGADLSDNRAHASLSFVAASDIITCGYI